jgi:hypothetical protein
VHAVPSGLQLPVCQQPAQLMRGWDLHSGGRDQLHLLPCRVLVPQPGYRAFKLSEWFLLAWWRQDVYTVSRGLRLPVAFHCPEGLQSRDLQLGGGIELYLMPGGLHVQDHLLASDLMQRRKL